MYELTRKDCEAIHREALGILSDVGVELGHRKLLDPAAAIGAQVDRVSMRVRFPPRLVEEFIAGCPKTDWSVRQPRLLVRASIYGGKHLDPDTGLLAHFDRRRLTDYFRLAKALPHVSARLVTGCPWPVSPRAVPLYERLHGWLYGAEPSGFLHPTEASGSLLELYEAYAELRGRPVRELFRGAVYLASPLKLGPAEAEQFAWWWERGFRVGIGHMVTGGISAPVTLAGAVTVNIAEEIALALLRKAFYGEVGLALLATSATADMRTLMRPYGRPEMALTNMMVASMARFYGVDCFGHSGLADAKLPSCEAGAQKTMSALATLLAGADAMIEAGLLGTDQVFSPIQMILDNELAGALKCFVALPEVTAETIAADLVREVGPGGLFTGTAHTARHFRAAAWEPSVWSRQMLSAWEAGGMKADTDRARELYYKIIPAAPDPTELMPEEQQTLTQVIRRVEASG